MRKEMEKNGLTERDIRIVIRMVDDSIQRQAATQSKRAWTESSGMGFVVIGTAICAFGTFMTLGTYFGIIDTGNSFVIAYGAILGGLATLFYGISQRNKAQSGGTIKRRWKNDRQH